jgi:hypothetical protein
MQVLVDTSVDDMSNQVREMSMTPAVSHAPVPSKSSMGKGKAAEVKEMAKKRKRSTTPETPVNVKRTKTDDEVEEDSDDEEESDTAQPNPTSTVTGSSATFVPTPIVKTPIPAISASDAAVLKDMEGIIENWNPKSKGKARVQRTGDAQLVEVFLDKSRALYQEVSDEGKPLVAILASMMSKVLDG